MSEETEDKFDTYESEEDMASEFGSPKTGIVERAKTLAKAKVSGVKKKLKDEQEYQDYKHPDVAYLKGGKTTTDFEKSEEFAERLEKEKETKAEKKAASAVKRAARRAAVKTYAKTTVKPAVKKIVTKAITEMKKGDTGGKPGGGMFEMGPGFSTFGETGGKKQSGFSLFGEGQGKKSADFSIFGEGKKGKKTPKQQFDIFGAGTPKSFDPIGFGGKGKKKKRQGFSIW